MASAVANTNRQSIIHMEATIASQGKLIRDLVSRVEQLEGKLPLKIGDDLCVPLDSNFKDCRGWSGRLVSVDTEHNPAYAILTDVRNMYGVRLPDEDEKFGMSLCCFERS